MLPNSVDVSSIVVEADVPDSVQAPIERGEEIGVATMSLCRRGDCHGASGGCGKRLPQRDALLYQPERVLYLLPPGF